MNMTESRRTRHLLLRIDRGEEMPAVLLRALEQAEARSAWITGIGTLEAMEIALFDAASKSFGRPRRIEGPAELLSLTGNLASHEGASFLRLSATLARETELGMSVFGGELVWARAYALELHITVFDDLTLTRGYDERTGLALLTFKTQPEGARAGASSETARAVPAGIGHTAVSASEAPAAPSATSPSPAAPAMPARPVRPKEEPEIYPEVGDLVMHFHFGECEVSSSDGDRIRLRQVKDGRMREVSLSMLKIEPPTVDGESGKRHFRLARRN